MDNLNDILKDRVIKEVNTDGENTILIYLKPKKQPLPKSWDEFCEMYPCSEKEYFISSLSKIVPRIEDESCSNKRHNTIDICNLPDRATAEAVLALCQLIQLRNAYNGDWVPDWTNSYERKYLIVFDNGLIAKGAYFNIPSSPLYFKSEDLRDEFLRNFRPLIEKLKPLYGIKEGGDNE